jgi:hypothetical protein
VKSIIIEVPVPLRAIGGYRGLANHIVYSFFMRNDFWEHLFVIMFFSTKKAEG